MNIVQHHISFVHFIFYLWYLFLVVVDFNIQFSVVSNLSGFANFFLYVLQFQIFCIRKMAPWAASKHRAVEISSAPLTLECLSWNIITLPICMWGLCSPRGICKWVYYIPIVHLLFFSPLVFSCLFVSLLLSHLPPSTPVRPTFSLSLSLSLFLSLSFFLVFFVVKILFFFCKTTCRTFSYSKKKSAMWSCYIKKSRRWLSSGFWLPRDMIQLNWTFSIWIELFTELK